MSDKPILSRTLSRRQALRSLGLLGAAPLASCSGDGTTEDPTDVPANTSCVLIAQETEGPYPLASVLSNPAMIRSDIRETRTGVPIQFVLSIVNVNQGCAPITNAAVYVWYCDKDGNYSGYGSVQGQT